MGHRSHSRFSAIKVPPHLYLELVLEHNKCICISRTKRPPRRYAAKGRPGPALSREATGGVWGADPPAKIFDLTLVVLRKPEFFTLEKCI